ncbi:sensor histidine kinase [Klebsiella pneumoniae]|uniref:sensor histidine kinase n=1 Tax=Klebsiella pneumoniae TaxID=573 RepID=UPI000E2D5D8A|nr:ATP-binding protein [Klebsiella pneumoniae]SXL86786.1 two-component system sensor protein [Klebsiella pneumoniae]SXM10724.1 two-component system sensor protein [Klebsiella pneumoniae]
MKVKQPQTLWRWLCLRILTLAIGTVLLIALCMWLRFTVQYLWTTHRMQEAVLNEFLTLREHPELNPARYHEIIDKWWGISFSSPSIASSDWLTVGVLVLVTIPFIAYFGLRHARPLSAQFSQLRIAADEVTDGHFGAQAELTPEAPAELVQFAQNFNAMTRQLARYEKELRASHVAMAHELRSPLTAAMVRLQALLDGVFTPEQRHLALIMGQLSCLSRLIDELHLLSIADAGQLSLEKVRCCPSDILRERLLWIKPQLDEAGINVVSDMPETSVLNVDPFRLGQVFTILMENALRYAGKGTTLFLSTRSINGNYEIIFQDTGPGVSQEFLDVMFERFVRGDTSRARHSGGSGLGLSIAQAICHAHGGTIEASLPSGGGLRMRIVLQATA